MHFCSTVDIYLDTGNMILGRTYKNNQHELVEYFTGDSYIYTTNINTWSDTLGNKFNGR